MPFNISGAVIVTPPKVEGIVLIGGYNGSDDEYSGDLLELKVNPLEWVILDQKLKYPRLIHVSLAIQKIHSAEEKNSVVFFSDF